MAKNKVNRPKARLPRGFADRSPQEIRRTAAMSEVIRGVFERWGFEPVETPFIEYADALGKFLPDEDRPNEGVFAFQDDDEQWLSLRYDLTAPLARMVAEHFDAIPKPYKSFRNGWVFRNEKPGPGRFRQFMQFDADIVGAASPLADAEICMMATDTMDALGFHSGEYVVRVSTRVLMDGILDALGLSGEGDKGTRLTVLRAVDKYDRLGVAGVRALLTEGRKDQSGDFTKGAGLSAAAADSLIAALGLVGDGAEVSGAAVVPHSASPDYSNGDRINALAQSGLSSPLLDSAIETLSAIHENLAAGGYGEDRVRIDPSVVRGLEYYTGPVFEAELTFSVADENGTAQRFGSVGGGGRYDGLVGRFRSQDVPATGYSVGVSRMAAALEARTDTMPISGPVIITVMDRDEVPRYQAITAKLRAALNQGGQSVPVEMYIGDSGMKAQLKYADRRNAPCVVIQGSHEREAGKVQIKDLAAGKRASEEIASREDWVAARPAQVEVDDSIEAIVAAVRTILQ
ncbi:MAG: histidine--tRNA ligase [Pseudomonadota bacterium]